MEDVMGLTKRIPAEGGSGGGRGHSAMEHWMKTAEIKDAARVVRRRTSRDAVSEGLSELFVSSQKANGDHQSEFVSDGSSETTADHNVLRND